MSSTYLMFGPDLDSGKMTQDYISAENVGAYEAAGWQKGPLPEVEPDSEPLVIHDPLPPPVVPAAQMMHGPEIDGDGKVIVIEAEIAPENVIAYQAAGWSFGPIPESNEEVAPDEAEAKPKKKK